VQANCLNRRGVGYTLGTHSWRAGRRHGLPSKFLTCPGPFFFDLPSLGPGRRKRGRSESERLLAAFVLSLQSLLHALLFPALLQLHTVQPSILLILR
jgi:hypothetical protein